VYIVVAAGETIVVPEEAKVPRPWSMVTDVALDTFQLKTDELPPVMPGGLAMKELTTGRPATAGAAGGAAGVPATITWQVAVRLPEELVAVRV
jgi:hypothetical protein